MVATPPTAARWITYLNAATSYSLVLYESPKQAQSNAAGWNILELLEVTDGPHTTHRYRIQMRHTNILAHSDVLALIKLYPGAQAFDDVAVISSPVATVFYKGIQNPHDGDQHYYHEINWSVLY